MKMPLIIFLNRATGEYVAGMVLPSVQALCQTLMSPLPQDAALLDEDIGTSHWSRADHIVLVNQQTIPYVCCTYHCVATSEDAYKDCNALKNMYRTHPFAIVNLM